jgi:hypothetical protein
MKNNRKIYIVMGHEHKNNVTYISEVCSSRKKAEQHKKYIEILMRNHEDTIRTYWIYDARVC